VTNRISRIERSTCRLTLRSTRMRSDLPLPVTVSAARAGYASSQHCD
jgi:hypothetical protein